MPKIQHQRRNNESLSLNVMQLPSHETDLHYAIGSEIRQNLEKNVDDVTNMIYVHRSLQLCIIKVFLLALYIPCCR